MAGKSTASILEVSRKSGNLKGTIIKALKVASRDLLEVVDTLVSRTEADETRHLRTANSRLIREVEALKAEIKAHRREFVELKTAAAKSSAAAVAAPSLDADCIEELRRSIVSSVGVLVNARFANIEERLLPERVKRP